MSSIPPPLSPPPLPPPVVHNPYEAPQAELADVEANTEAARFYVVAPGKFLLLFIGTLGVYQLYWFYKHWAQLNRVHRSYWPIPRAIFAVFFTHTLFEEIDTALRRAGARYRWSSSGMATVYVIAAVINFVASRLGNRPDMALLSAIVTFALMLPTGFALYTAQGAANAACGDPSGEGNRTITAGNVVWLVIGAVLWLFNLLGFYVLATGDVSFLG
jgi:hypothetical protein